MLIAFSGIKTNDSKKKKKHDIENYTLMHDTHIFSVLF